MENEERIAKKHMPDIIRRYRALAGLSQRQLADSMGVSKGFISALEGGRSVPNLDMLVVLTSALNVRPGELVDALVGAAGSEQEKSERVPKN